MTRLLAITSLLAAAIGCDYSGKQFYQEPNEVPGVIHLDEFTPSVLNSAADIDASVYYGEVGPTGIAEAGGTTFTFVGTGGPVCIWVDPELVSWSQSVDALSPDLKYTYPDNAKDDGDIDLYAGFAVYYTGSPGEEIGDFEVLYQDSLSNDLPIELNECTIPSLNEAAGGHSGRGAPEYCELSATQPGVSYMVLMQTFSIPLDDDRLSYGLLVSEGDCGTIKDLSVEKDECVIKGEAINPATGETWANSILFEETFCDDAQWMSSYCEAEQAQLEAEGKACHDEDVHCFCGDLTDTPEGGAVSDL